MATCALERRSHCRTVCMCVCVGGGSQVGEAWKERALIQKSREQ